MAVTYRPGQTFTVNIGDAKFHLRQPSCAQGMGIAEQIDSQRNGGGEGKKGIALFCEIIQQWIVAWDIEGVPFDREKLADLLSLSEVSLLLRALVSGGMTRDDAGK